MTIVFYRTIKKDGSVKASAAGVIDGKHIEIGVLNFPNKQIWTRFIGALQRGAIGTSDFEIVIENAPEAP